MMKSMVADAKANLEQLFHCSAGFDLTRTVSSFSLLYLVVEFETDADVLLFKLGPLSDFQSTYPDMVVMDVRAEVRLEMPQRSSVTKVMTR